MKDTKVDLTVLRQVHVLMSHGERTPNERELAMLGAPPPDHVFVPYGAGAMTNIQIKTRFVSIVVSGRFFLVGGATCPPPQGQAGLNRNEVSCRRDCRRTLIMIYRPARVTRQRDHIGAAGGRVMPTADSILRMWAKFA
ncbi:hypothetical protein EVAR_36529_1 [Eumeta japonica]|uniref:Uncharacterized protein n=1 Tax=Eumeta variegata TaxID=151549 RepID=A0A4C1XBF0_EUMVA|nr:hypothetical protein EVAR_36529_1 [Eumeta japonica]